MIRRRHFSPRSIFSVTGTGLVAGVPPPDFVFDWRDGDQISVTGFPGDLGPVENTASPVV